MKTGSKTVQYRKDGTIAQMTQGKTVTTFNTDGSHKVQNPTKSYTQKNAQVNGQNVVQRTYSSNNRTVVRNYNTYYRSGYSYHSYVPFVAYDPWFYGYCLHPWHPFSYTWAWAYDPWYSNYGYYYRPYSTYYGPSYWLTDYLIADSIRSNAQAANAAANRAEQAVHQVPQITNDMKDQIREQVEEVIRAHEKKEAVNVAETLRDAGRIFVVSEDIDVLVEGTEQQCSLTAGDLIKNREKVGDSDQFVKMIVVASKKGSCPAKTKIAISLVDLQEMQNAFAERLEEGMDKLQAERPDEKAK